MSARWRWVVFVVFGLAAYGVAWGILRDGSRLPSLSGAVWAWLTTALAAQMGAKWAYGLLFREAVALTGLALGRWAAFKAALVGSGIARLVPVGGVFTPAAMAWTVRRESAGTGGAAVRTTVLSYGGLLVGTGLAILWIRARGLHAALQVSMVVGGAIAIALGAVLWIGSGRLASLVRRLPRWVRARVTTTLIDRSVTSRELGFLSGRVLLEALALGVVLRALGLELTPMQTLAAFGLSQLIGGLPGPPGGFGLVEAGLVGILAAFGFPAGETVAPVLIYRVISYWIPALAGLWAGGDVFLRLVRPTLVADRE